MVTFYNAGAGSGKTYTLSERLYEFLTVQKGDPSQVILTTFTVKAAEELKERVRQKLLEKSEHEKAAQVSNALIGTINGVCSTLLERYSMEIGLNTELKILDQHSVDALFEKFLAGKVDDAVYHQLNHLSYRFSLYENDDFRRQEKMKPCWPKLVKKLVDNFRNYNFGKQQMIDSKEAALQMITDFLTTKQRLRIQDNLNAIRQKPANWLEKRTPGVGDVETLESLKKLIELRSFSWNDLAKAGGKLNKGFISKNADIAEVVAQLSNYHECEEFRDEWLELTGLLYDTAFKLINEYQEYKSERGLIDFTDQEALLLQMLNENDTVIEEIKATYKLIMVDEFQDCSPLQIALFTNLQQLITDSIWVGDPKQSIYGFRGADEILFTNTMNAVEQSGSKIEILGTSFRSRPGIVEAINEIFTGIFKGIIPDNRITLKPSGDALKKESKYSEPSLQVLFCDAANLEEYFCILAEKVKEICSEHINIYEKSTGSFRKIQGSDIALLFRDRDNMHNMAGKLKAIDVPVSIESIGFQDQAEVLWISSLIRLLINSHDELALSNIMLMEGAVTNVEELIKKRLDYLDLKKNNNPEPAQLPHWKENSETARRVEANKDLISQMPLLQAIEMLISLTDLPLFAARWTNFELRLTNINQVLTLAKEYQEQGKVLGMATTLSGFLDHLQEHATIPAVSSKEAVTLMTIHEAKGLEWPMVIPVKTSVTYFDCKNIFNSMHIVQPKTFDVNNVLQGQQIIYLPWPFASAKKVCNGLKASVDMLDSKLHAYEKAKKEEDRLLYVALTRAKEYLLLPSNTDAKSYSGIESDTRHNKSPIFTTDDLKSLLNQTQGKLNTTVLLKKHQIGIQRLTAIEEEKQNTIPRIAAGVEYYDHGPTLPKVHDPRYISPSTKVTKDISSVQVTDIGLMNATLSCKAGNEISDEEIGNAIHLAFASWKPEKDKSQRISTIESLFSRLGINGKIDAVLVDESFQGFWSFIQTKYQPKNIWREYPVSSVATENGEVISGIIDLLIETPAGLVLIDHKTFRGSFDKQVLNTNNDFYAGKYMGQLDSYKEVLEKATGKEVIANLIHYVMQGRVVELNSVVPTNN